MTDKKLTLQIEGKAVVLDFGTNYFYEFYKNATGHDLVKDPGMELLDLSSTEVFKFLQGMIAAGNQSDCALREDVKGVLPEHTIRKFVMSKGDADTLGLLHEVLAASNGVTLADFKAKLAEKREQPAAEEKKTA